MNIEIGHNYRFPQYGLRSTDFVFLGRARIMGQSHWYLAWVPTATLSAFYKCGGYNPRHSGVLRYHRPHKLLPHDLEEPPAAPAQVLSGIEEVRRLPSWVDGNGEPFRSRRPRVRDQVLEEDLPLESYHVDLVWKQDSVVLART